MICIYVHKCSLIGIFPFRGRRPRTDRVSFMLMSLHPLIDGDVLPDQPGNLIGLFGLNPRDSLLHQITAFHVQEQKSVFGLNFPRQNDFGEWIM